MTILRAEFDELRTRVRHYRKVNEKGIRSVQQTRERGVNLEANMGPTRQVEAIPQGSSGRWVGGLYFHLPCRSGNGSITEETVEESSARNDDVSTR